MQFLEIICVRIRTSKVQEEHMISQKMHQPWCWTSLLIYVIEIYRHPTELSISLIIRIVSVF